MVESIGTPRAPILYRIIWYWIPVLVIVGGMYYFSTDVLSSSHTRGVIEKIYLRFMPHASSHALESLNYYVRKAAHVFEYGLLGALLFRAFRADNVIRWHLKWAVYAFASAASWAMLDEFHQTFTRFRDGSIWDVVLDSCGVLFGLILIGFYTKRKDQTAGLPRKTKPALIQEEVAPVE